MTDPVEEYLDSIRSELIKTGKDRQPGSTPVLTNDQIQRLVECIEAGWYPAVVEPLTGYDYANPAILSPYQQRLMKMALDRWVGFIRRSCQRFLETPNYFIRFDTMQVYRQEQFVDNINNTMGKYAAIIKSLSGGMDIALLGTEKVMVDILVTLLRGLPTEDNGERFFLTDLNIAIVKDFFAVLLTDLERALFAEDTDPQQEVVIDQISYVSCIFFSDYPALHLELELYINHRYHAMELFLSQACLERWKQRNKFPMPARENQRSVQHALPVPVPVEAGALDLVPGSRIILPARTGDRHH